VNDDSIIVKHEEKVGNSSVRINAAIADRVHAHGLPFILSETARFHHVIRLAKFAPTKYEPPKCNLIAVRLLLANHK
jgi:hypothetical protein